MQLLKKLFLNKITNEIVEVIDIRGKYIVTIENKQEVETRTDLFEMEYEEIKENSTEEQNLK